jgi:hypothetical protein
MALGFAALLLQGVSKLVADLRLLRSHGAAAEDVTPPARVAGGIR